MRAIWTPKTPLLTAAVAVVAGLVVALPGGRATAGTDPEALLRQAAGRVGDHARSRGSSRCAGATVTVTSRPTEPALAPQRRVRRRARRQHRRRRGRVAVGGR